MHSRRLERFGDFCSHQIARGETPHPLPAHQIPTRKARVIHVGTTVAPSPCCLDCQRQAPSLLNSDHIPNTQSVIGMPLLDPPSCPVPSRPAPTPSADGQTQLTQALYEGKTCGIDGTPIFEWDAGLLLHLWMPELSSGLVPFGLITVMATEHEIGYAIRATTTPWHYMVQFKRPILRTT